MTREPQADRRPRNSPGRVEELRRHALAHQAARDASSGTGGPRGYSVTVRYRDRSGAEAEVTGFIAATHLANIRIARLAMLGGGFVTVDFRHVIVIERAARIRPPSQAAP